MFEARWREMGQVLLLHGIALSAELVQHRLHVYRIPDDHGIGDHVETHRLIGLGFLLLATNHPFVRHEEKIAQGMQGFAFIELGY